MSMLSPIFACIALGWLCRRTGFLDEAFWRRAEALTYYVLFPALLTGNLAAADYTALPALAMCGAVATGVIAVTGCALFLQSRLRLPGPVFSSIFQGAMRPNTYVGLAAAQALFGQEGLALAAVALLAFVPLVNLLCVPVVAHCSCETPRPVGRILLELPRNPILLGCAAGLALAVWEPPLPMEAYEFLRLLGRGALPLGLLAVGAGLAVADLGTRIWPILLASALKFGVLPAGVWLACSLYHVPPRAAAVCVLFAALPAASSAYILARQLGGDERLMAGVIAVQTLLAAATLPLTMRWLG